MRMLHQIRDRAVSWGEIESSPCLAKRKINYCLMRNKKATTIRGKVQQLFSGNK